MKKMKKTASILLLVLMSFSTLANEICNNGIDDDGDGMIDLNDSDCDCTSASNVQSLIPNHDFENYSDCPNSFSELYKCNNWIQASDATSDYFNTCGMDHLLTFIDNPQNGSPSANGFVGFHNAYFNSGNYKEYIGACLSSPMEAGKTYKIKMLVGFGPTIDGKIVSLPSVNITLYGNPTCNSIPFTGYDCPLVGNNGFVQLATKTVTGSNEWVETEITFTPSTNMNVLVIGPDCFVSPLSFDNFEAEYYYLDRLLINEERFFNNQSITRKGEYCKNTFTFETTTAPTETIQWFKDGVAIAGETNTTISVDTSDHSNYVCVVTDANNVCRKSNSLSVGGAINCFIEEVNIYVPNSFTPDIDNLNELFGPVISGKLMDYSFQVFDRWGERVFTSSENILLWNGKFKNTDSPQGIYSWRLTGKINGKTDKVEKTGHVLLIR